MNVAYLRSQLNNTGLANKDNPMYQLVKGIIDALQASPVSSGSSSNLSANLTSNPQFIVFDDIVVEDPIIIPQIPAPNIILLTPQFIYEDNIAEDPIIIPPTVIPPTVFSTPQFITYDDNIAEDPIITPPAIAPINTTTTIIQGSQFITYDDIVPEDPIMIGGTGGGVGGLFTQGSVIFAGPGGFLAQDNAKFFWDDTNFRLGIGITSPATILDVHPARSSGGDVTGITLSDGVTGTQTANHGIQIAWSSNAGSTIAKIGFEVGGTGTNNESRISFYTQNTAGGLTNQLFIDSLGKLNAASLFAKYNNIATAGWGVPAIYARGRVTAQTTINVTVTSYANGASDASFLVIINALITAYTAGSLQGQVAYTDESNTARTQPLPMIAIGGGVGVGISAASTLCGIPIQIRVKASTTITITTQQGSAFTGTYNAEAEIMQVA